MSITACLRKGRALWTSHRATAEQIQTDIWTASSQPHGEHHVHKVPCYVKICVNAATDKDVQRAHRLPPHLLVKLQSLYRHWAHDSVYSASSKDMTNYLESKHCLAMILCHWESFESKMMSWFCYCSDSVGSFLMNHLHFLFLTMGQIRQTVKFRMNWMKNLGLNNADPLTMVRLSVMSLPRTHRINTQLKEEWPRSHQCLGIAAILSLSLLSISKECVCVCVCVSNCAYQVYLCTWVHMWTRVCLRKYVAWIQSALKINRRVNKTRQREGVFPWAALFPSMQR